MGVLISDGSLTNNGVTFVPGDKEVPPLVAAVIDTDYELHENADYGTSTRYSVTYYEHGKNPMAEYIREVGLNVTSEQKFIPSEYLRGAVSQRKQLLAGLLDTDGTVNGARCRFSTTSNQLCQDVIELVRGLGGMATFSPIPGRSRDRDGQKSQELPFFIVNARLPFNPFGRQSCRNKWKRSLRLVQSIVSIVPDGKEECTCILTSSPDHTYITENHIVTHNTPISLLAVRHKAAFPCLVIAPANVKLKWEREVNTWIGKRATPAVLFGRTPGLITGDVVIMNYEIVDAWKEALQGVSWRAIILDESHRIKNKKAKVSEAINEIVKKVDPPVRLCLSGTPVKNQPKEFVNQFKFLGSMNILGTEWHYLNRFCWDPYAYGDYGMGSGNATEREQKDLGKLLRTSVMCRHLKKYVEKQLPEKQRTVIEVELSNRSTYDAAEAEFSDWVQGGVQMAPTEQLSKLTTLRGVAAEGKITAAVSQVDEILRAGHKVVVFAYHKRIQKALYDSFTGRKGFPKGARIFASDTAKVRDENIQKFQNDETCRWIVCSLMAAKEGIDLYAGDHAVFVELIHTPTDLSQAEDRIHRIGQTSQRVNIYYIIGRDSVDQDMMTVLDSKRAMIQRITDGKEDAAELFSGTSSGAVVQETIGRIIARHMPA